MWYKNSLILTLITVVLTLLVCYFIAYGLTMYKFKLQGFLFFLHPEVLSEDSACTV